MVERLLRADDIIAAYNAVNPILEFCNRVNWNWLEFYDCRLLLTCHLCIDTRQPSSSTSDTPADDSHKLERVFSEDTNKSYLKLARGSLVHQRSTRVALAGILDPAFVKGAHLSWSQGSSLKAIDNYSGLVIHTRLEIFGPGGLFMK